LDWYLELSTMSGNCQLLQGGGVMAEPPVAYQRIKGSYRSPVPGATRVGPADQVERASVSIRLRRRAGAPLLDDAGRSPALPVRLTREEFAAAYGADPADIERVVAFANNHGLTVEETSIPRGTVVLAGTVVRLSRWTSATTGWVRQATAVSAVSAVPASGRSGSARGQRGIR